MKLQKKFPGIPREMVESCPDGLHPSGCLCSKQTRLSSSRNETSTEGQFLQWAASQQDSSGIWQESFRCPLTSCPMMFSQARQMMQHISSSHSIPDSEICHCPEHHNNTVGRRDTGKPTARDAYFPHSRRAWSLRRCKAGRVFRKCFGLGSSKETGSSTQAAPRLEAACGFEARVPETSVPWLELDGTPIFELSGTQVHPELPGESMSSLSWTAYLGQAYPAETYHAPMDIDGDLELLSPVSPVSAFGAESCFSDFSRTDFFGHDDGGSLVTTAYGGTNADTVAAGNPLATMDSYTPQMHDIYQEGHPDPTGIVSTQNGYDDVPLTPHNPGLGIPSSPMDTLPPVPHPIDVVQQIRSDIVQDLADNSLDGLHVMLDAIRDTPDIWFRDCIMRYKSPRKLLRSCLSTLRRVTLGYPMTDDDSFFLSYLACTTVPIMRGYCVLQRERELSIDAPPSMNLRIAMESCIGYFELMNHITALRQRLEDGAAMPGQGLSVPDIRGKIILPLLREPLMEVFEPLATGVVDALEGGKQHGIYDVVAQLIHVGYTHGSPALYIYYVRAIILTSHAALMEAVMRQPLSDRYVGIIADLSNALEEPTATQATPHHQNLLLYTSTTPATPLSHREFDSSKASPLDMVGTPDSGYFSLSNTPPNTPVEQQAENTELFPQRRPLNPNSPTISHPTAHQKPLRRRSAPRGAPQEPNILQCTYCPHRPNPHPNLHYRKSNLRRHERTVHLERDQKFVCPHCNAEVGRSDNFKNHLKDQHGIEGERVGELGKYLKRGVVEAEGRRRRRT